MKVHGLGDDGRDRAGSRGRGDPRSTPPRPAPSGPGRRRPCAGPAGGRLVGPRHRGEKREDSEREIVTKRVRERIPAGGLRSADTTRIHTPHWVTLFCQCMVQCRVTVVRFSNWTPVDGRYCAASGCGDDSSRQPQAPLLLRGTLQHRPVGVGHPDEHIHPATAVAGDQTQSPTTGRWRQADANGC